MENGGDGVGKSGGEDGGRERVYGKSVCIGRNIKFKRNLKKSMVQKMMLII